MSGRKVVLKNLQSICQKYILLHQMQEGTFVVRQELKRILKLNL